MRYKFGYTPAPEPELGNYTLTYEGHEISVAEIREKFGEIQTNINIAKENFSLFSECYIDLEEGRDLSEDQSVALESGFNILGIKVNPKEILTAILKALSSFFKMIFEGLKTLRDLSSKFFKWVVSKFRKGEEEEAKLVAEIGSFLKENQDYLIAHKESTFMGEGMATKYVDMDKGMLEGNPGVYFKYLEGFLAKQHNYILSITGKEYTGNIARVSDEIRALVREIDIPYRGIDEVTIESIQGPVNKTLRKFYEGMRVVFNNKEEDFKGKGLHFTSIPRGTHPLALNANCVFSTELTERDLNEEITSIKPDSFKFTRTIEKERTPKRLNISLSGYQPEAKKKLKEFDTKPLERLADVFEKNNTLMEGSLASVIANTVSKEEYPMISFFLDVVASHQSELSEFVELAKNDKRLSRKSPILRLLLIDTTVIYDLLRISAGQRPSKNLPESVDVYEKNVEQFFNIAKDKGFFRDVEVIGNKRPDQKKSLVLVESLLKVIIANQYTFYNTWNNYVLLDCIRPYFILKDAYREDLQEYLEAMRNKASTKEM